MGLFSQIMFLYLQQVTMHNGSKKILKKIMPLYALKKDSLPFVHIPLRDVEILHDGILFCEKSFDFFLLTPKFVLSLFQSRIARQLNKCHSYHLYVYNIVFF